ncbi:MAG: hypothetical protein ACK5LV_02995 [Lachnospirales bacterium]
MIIIVGLFLILYSVVCLYVYMSRTPIMISMMRNILGKKLTDEEVLKKTMKTGSISFAISMVVFLFGSLI